MAFESISLFSNCGAGDVGFAKAGFNFVVMAELETQRLNVCLLNHPGAVGIVGDLRETWPQVVKSFRSRYPGGHPSLLAACPPCQGMSSARSDRGLANDPDAGIKDHRNLLVSVIANVAAELSPSLIVVENVQEFLSRKIRDPRSGVGISAARLLTENLASDYAVFPFLTDLADFAIPQFRKRAFLTFVRKDLSTLSKVISRKLAPYPIPTSAPEYDGSQITVRAALESFGLPSLDAKTAESAQTRIGRGLHSVPVWPDHRYPMVAAIPPHSGRSAWENKVCEKCGKVEVEDESAQCPRCSGPLLRPVVRVRRGFRLVNGFRTSTYKRMQSDAPSATITTATGHIGSNHTIHPYENRLLSPLECALLQTFPKRFKWGNALARYGHTNVRQMIGEAVPPHFTYLHGRTLRRLLTGRIEKGLISIEDSRCKRAQKKLLLETA
jgi:DNA (cytosine-5)-methyltransferase 1